MLLNLRCFQFYLFSPSLALARLMVLVNYILWSDDAFLRIDWVICQIHLLRHKLAQVVEAGCLSFVTPNISNSFLPFTAKVSRKLFLHMAQNIDCAQVIHVMHACYGLPCLLKGNGKLL